MNNIFLKDKDEEKGDTEIGVICISKDLTPHYVWSVFSLMKVVWISR